MTLGMSMSNCPFLEKKWRGLYQMRRAMRHTYACLPPAWGQVGRQITFALKVLDMIHRDIETRMSSSCIPAAAGRQSLGQALPGCVTPGHSSLGAGSGRPPAVPLS